MAARPHPRLAEVFALLVQSGAEARAAIIDRECAGDAALRRQVERLLVHDAVTEAATAGGFLLDGAPIASAETVVQAFARAMDEDGVAAGGPDEASYAPGTVVERYTIIRPVGAGGFGVVYLARQAPPEERPVALKIMESLPTSPRALRRFEDERHTLAQMDHPNVARIYSGGITVRGHPFFAMAFIAGAGPDTPAPRITEYADDRRLSVRERAELFVPVCLAVQHAHQKSIIHRDLKPSNILVAEADGRAMPRIIDFGIARLVDTAGTAGTDGRTLLTLREELLGTPAYMSPEQAGRAPVETRSDVYSLGVVLHELLCGSVPFPFDEKSGPIDVHLRAVREQEPARPSTAMMRTGHAARVAQARGTDPARLVRLLHGDLDTIVLKALEKQPARRYQSAEALAEDLRRHLESQPILARPPTIGYALAKFSRRYRSLVAAAAAVAVALVAATALSLSFGVRARNAERRAHEATGRAEAREATANLLAAWLALQRDNGATVRSRLDLVPRSLRGWEWGHIDFRSDRSVRTLRGHDYLVSALAASRDGTRLVSGDRNGAVLAWDIATDSGQPRRLRPEATDPAHDVWSLAWSPEGDSFATGSLDGTACAWPSDGSKSLREFRDQDGTTYGHVYAVAFSPDGTERQLAVGGGVPGGGSASPGREFGFVALRDLDTGTGTWIDDRTHTLPVNDLAFSRDGRWMASGADDGTVCVWSPAGDTPTLRIRLETGGEVNAVAINPAGNLLAAGTTTRAILMYELPSGRALRTLTGHTRPLASLTFGPKGDVLASAAWDGTVRLWSVEDGRPLAVLHGHGGRVNRVVITPDERLFSASDDTTVREWDLRSLPDVPAVRAKGPRINVLAFLADGTLAAATDEGIERWNPATCAALGIIMQGHAIGLIGVSPDGRTLAAHVPGALWLQQDGRAPIRQDIDPTLGDPLQMIWLPTDDHHVLLAFAHGLFAWSCTNVGDPPKRVGSGPGVGATLLHATMATAASNLVWSIDETVTVEGRAGPLHAGWQPRVAASTTSGLIAFDDREGRDLVVYDTRDGTERSRLVGHREQVRAVAFSPGGSRLASVAQDDTLRIWDWARGEEIMVLERPGSETAARPPVHFTAVAWSRDGKTIATGSDDGTIHLWYSNHAPVEEP